MTSFNERGSTAPNYVITSGWWCGEVADEVRKLQGSDAIREVSFFDQWKQSVLENTSPSKIMVLDSASPTTPSQQSLDGIEFLSVLKNPGHSTKHSGHYSGYMRSIIMGVTYAAMCDADYWVYVEQDVLLKGKGIIEHCIEHMTTPYMFGSGDGTPQFLQQSLIIIRKDGFYNFLKHLNAIEEKDSQIEPESKFLIASSWSYRLVPKFFYRQFCQRTRIGKLFRRLLRPTLPYFRGYDELPIGYGRARPIDFHSPFYYFQHGTEEELESHYQGLNNET